MTDQLPDSGPSRPADVPPPLEAAPPTEQEPLAEATLVEPAVPPVTWPTLTPVTPRRTSTLRWGVALLVVALVVGATSVAYAVLSAGATLSTLSGWVPADSYVYGEVRLDLPGDQRQRVADVLSKFPGFDDQSNLEQKVTEALDRIIGDASGGTESYSAVKPWLGDSVAFAIDRLPLPGAGLSPDASTTGGLAVIAIKDATAARDWLARHGQPGATTETYGGTTLTTTGPASSYAVLDTVILAGPPASVKAAIDSKGAGAFASTEGVKAASAAIEGDVIGLLYIDYKRLFDTLIASSPSTNNLFDQSIVDSLPSWAAFSLRARSDAVEVDGVMPRPSALPKVASHTSTLAARLPASTVASYELHDIATTVRTVLDQWKQQAALKDAVAQIEQALEVAGGFDANVGWIGDAAIVVSVDGTVPQGGIVIVPTNETAARDKLVQLNNLIVLGGASSGITSRDEAYADGTITVVDLGDAASLGNMFGSLAPGMPSGSGALSGRVELAYTLQRGLLVVGAGDRFVKSVLDTVPGSSLADQSRYKQALDLVGSSNSGQAFVDIAGIVSLVEPMIPPAQRDQFQKDVKPYVEPLVGFAFASTQDDLIRMRSVVTVH